MSQRRVQMKKDLTEVKSCFLKMILLVANGTDGITTTWMIYTDTVIAIINYQKTDIKKVRN